MTSPLIRPDMTLLDTVSQYQTTQAVFRSRDKQAGQCLLCNALFETIEQTARQYGLDLELLLADLEQAAAQDNAPLPGE